MEKVHKYKKLKDKSFKMPIDIVARNICKKCGKLAITGLCDKALDGNDIKLEYFAKGTQPKESCDCHVKYSFSGTTGKLLSSTSDSANVKIYLKKDESSYTEATKDTPYIIPNMLK